MGLFFAGPRRPSNASLSLAVGGVDAKQVAWAAGGSIHVSEDIATAAAATTTAASPCCLNRHAA